MNNKNSVKTVVAVAIGAALFFVLGRFVAIPSGIPNTNISLQYAVLGLLAAMYGPVAGGLIGFIGHTLIDLSWGGSPWWSWVIASTFVGIVVGLFAKKLNVNEGEFSKKDVVTYAIANVIAHAVAWIGVAPVLDILIYAEPVDKVFAQGAMAAVANILTAVIVRRAVDCGLYQDHCQEGLLGKAVRPDTIIIKRRVKFDPPFPVQGSDQGSCMEPIISFRDFTSNTGRRRSRLSVTSIWISCRASGC